jgi:hypothetical protein
MGATGITESNVNKIISQNPNAEIPCDPTKSFGNFCKASPSSNDATKTAEAPTNTPPKVSTDNIINASKSKIIKGVSNLISKAKTRIELEQFAKVEPELNRNLENISLKTGVPIAQIISIAMREAKLNNVGDKYNNDFIKGFLTKFVDLNNTRNEKDVAIVPWEYKALLQAGGLAVLIAKEGDKQKDKQRLAATGPITQMFDTYSGPITFGANKYAAD